MGAEREIRQAAVIRADPQPVRKRHCDFLPSPDVMDEHAILVQEPDAVAYRVHLVPDVGRLAVRRTACGLGCLRRCNTDVASANRADGDGQEERPDRDCVSVPHKRSFPEGAALGRKRLSGPGVCKTRLGNSAASFVEPRPTWSGTVLRAKPVVKRFFVVSITDM